MKQPNLFQHATSELSQDAFICWLLEWASPEYKKNNPKLHKCGTKLINVFFTKHKKIPPVITEVKVIKQDSNIDVLCIINSTYAIIIEDKTNTKDHSDQLKRYYSEMESRSYDKENIIPIYFKTHDQACYKSIKEKNYEVFLRSDLLLILNEGDKLGVENSIFQDFRIHLQSIEDSVQSYSSKPISEWSPKSWIGFYLRLQEELGAGHWDYVANPSGGFQGFWWGFKGNEECKQYLQLEEKKLCFKIYVSDPDKQKKLRSKWYELIKSKPSSLNISKPKRFGKGKWMTVMEEQESYLKVDNYGIIDIQETVSYLKRAENHLGACTD